MTAKHANELDDIPADFVAGDLRSVIDHPYLTTGCWYEVTDEDYVIPSDETKREHWKDLDNDELLDLFSDDGSDYEMVANFAMHSDHSYWPCSVLMLDDDENNDGSRYVVRIHPHLHKEVLPWEEHDVPRILTDYPRKAIHFFVKPYESDQQLPHAFRHAIGIPDEIFPKTWRREYVADQEEEEEEEETADEL